MKLNKKSQKWMYFIVVGVHLGFSVAAGLIIGQYVDSKLDTNPYFTLLGLIGGVVAGFSLLIKLMKMKNDNK